MKLNNGPILQAHLKAAPADVQTKAFKRACKKIASSMSDYYDTSLST